MVAGIYLLYHIFFVGEGIEMYLMFDHTGLQFVILTIIWWWEKLGID
jgi:hypothetical protein